MVANEMYVLVNAHREANGKAPLQVLSRLEGMANAWSKHMADTGVFDHVINGKDADETFPQFGNAGLENIAMGVIAGKESLTSQDAKYFANKLFNMWKNSAGHNNSMLGKWNKTIGFGFHAVKNGSTWSVYATQEFYGGTKSIEEPGAKEDEPVVEEQLQVEEQQTKPALPEQPKEEAPQVEIQTTQPTVELN